MNKVILFISMLTVCVVTTIFAEKSSFLTELNSKNAEYYSGKRFIPVSEIEAILRDIENSSALTDDERLFLKLEAYALWANNSIPSQTFITDYPTLKEIYKNIRKTQDFRNGALSSNVYAAFAEFASAMIPLADINRDIYSYNFSVDEEEYARLAMLKNPGNIQANVLYGMFILITAKYKSDQKYSKIAKFLADTEGLPEYMVFRTHIHRSMMYMKINEIKKSFEELKKAESIYPTAFFVSMLKDSYAHGGTGFSDSDRSDLGNFMISDAL